MIIIFVILSVLIILVGFIGGAITDSYDNDGWLCLAGLGAFLFIAGIVAIFFLVNQVKELDIIDKKIEMYQEENTKIENDIDMLVKQYMEHEKKTLSEFKSESSITLVNLYPDLKSNELVQQQLNIYVENNNKIKELKNNKLEYQLSKWWLYFGRIE